MTQTLARAHAKDGVLAYVIAPGIVNTRLSKISAATRGGEDSGAGHPPPRRNGAAGEVANLVAFLSSGLCRHLSGATLDINGAAYIR